MSDNGDMIWMQLRPVLRKYCEKIDEMKKKELTLSEEIKTHDGELLGRPPGTW